MGICENFCSESFNTVAFWLKLWCSCRVLPGLVHWKLHNSEKYRLNSFNLHNFITGNLQLLRLYSTHIPDKFIEFIWIQQNFKNGKIRFPTLSTKKTWLVQLSLFEVISNFSNWKRKQGNTDWRSTSKTRFVFIFDLCLNTAARSQNEVA